MMIVKQTNRRDLVTNSIDIKPLVEKLEATYIGVTGDLNSNGFKRWLTQELSFLMTPDGFNQYEQLLFSDEPCDVLTENLLELSMDLHWTLNGTTAFTIKGYRLIYTKPKD